MLSYSREKKNITKQYIEVFFFYKKNIKIKDKGKA